MRQCVNSLCKICKLTVWQNTGGLSQYSETADKHMNTDFVSLWLPLSGYIFMTSELTAKPLDSGPAKGMYPGSIKLDHTF